MKKEAGYSVPERVAAYMANCSWQGAVESEGQIPIDDHLKASKLNFVTPLASVGPHGDQI